MQRNSGFPALFVVACLCPFLLIGEETHPSEIVLKEEVDRTSEFFPHFETSLDFTSRQLTYGLADNLDPIITPSALMCYHGFTLESAMIWDTTKWGRKHGGYGNREGKYQELAFGPGYGYTFSIDEWPNLPSCIEINGNWIYEYHPRKNADKGYENPDTEFVNLSTCLPDLWLQPGLSVEIDTMRDQAFYFLAEIGHSFTLVQPREGEEEEILSLSVILAQGLGDAQRNKADVGVDSWAFKDVSATVSLNWKATSWLFISPYGAFYEQVSSRIRDNARYYSIEDEKHDSFQFIYGLTAKAVF